MYGLGKLFKSLAYDLEIRSPFHPGMRRLRPYAPDMFEFIRFGEMIIISREKKYIYVINPKVASTTIRNLLHVLNGFEELEQPKDVMSHNISGFVLPRHLKANEFVDILEDPDYFRFSFSRNPFDRLVSAYVYFKKLTEEEAKKSKKRKRVFQRHCDPRRDIARKMALSFEGFVEEICLNNDHVLDQHWRPQVEVLRTDIISYDFVGKMENFSEDMTHVLHRLNAPSEIVEKTACVTNASSRKKSVAEWYDKRLADLIRQKFAQDFEQFGYSLDVPE